MVGDRLYTDIAMAGRAGVVGILVLSGEATRESLSGSPHKPDIVVQDISELADLLEKVKQ
jgi:ribonucleotide monophosphatase NagD (HAD superfamily)